MIPFGTAIEPLIKWPGGKRRLLASLSAYIPESYETYREPFFGGGALFFALQPNSAVLTDCQSDLIQTYCEIRTRPKEVIRLLRSLENSESSFYSIRSLLPDNRTARAARFIYLCNLSFNGIYRVNRRGEFNVPYGHKPHLQICDETKIHSVARLLRRAKIEALDFESALECSATGDFIYLDPPYTVAHGNNGFTKYNANMFSWDDQKRLARTAERLRALGYHVLISNADHPSIRSLYPNFSEHIIPRHSVMAAASHHRRPVTESLFYIGAKEHVREHLSRG